MTEAKQLNESDLKSIQAHHNADLCFCFNALLSHIAWLEGERDHAVAQSQANLDSWQKALDSFNQVKVTIAESTRTLLIEVVKGKHEEFAPLGIARKVCNEIIVALEAAEFGDK